MMLRGEHGEFEASVNKLVRLFRKKENKTENQKTSK
jgi:hypothetical protein